MEFHLIVFYWSAVTGLLCFSIDGNRILFLPLPPNLINKKNGAPFVSLTVYFMCYHRLRIFYCTLLLEEQRRLQSLKDTVIRLWKVA